MEQSNRKEEEEEERRETECSFQWDESSQLYYHATSGFYHDPNAGWYYNSRDGLYYKFEDGEYVLLQSDQGDKFDISKNEAEVPDDSVQDEPCLREDMDCSSIQGDKSEVYKEETVLDEGAPDTCIDKDLTENLPPPSEWLEDTLIELYLSGYSNEALNTASDPSIPIETDNMDSLDLSINGASKDETYELEEGEWIPDEDYDEDAYRDEENWRAQYGQVVKSDEESCSFPDLQVVDLWEWEVVKGNKKGGGGKKSVYRVVGRLVRRSNKLHPSIMPIAGKLFKTAPICEAQRDLIRVTSGQVYKLRIPRARYLASLSMFDSSNPTNDWGFPELSVEKQTLEIPKSTLYSESKTINGVPISVSQMNQSKNVYRDRVKERRALHGGFGVGPGHKKLTVGIESDCEPSSPVNDCPAEAAAESLNMSFGAGSYARKLLQGMGWKEGEALGDSMKGLTEPLKAVANKGNAGLGWNFNARKY